MKKGAEARRETSKPEPFAAPRDLLQDRRAALDAIFQPRNVAVIGATEKDGSVGRTVVWNLITNPFGGTVFPVNPKHPSVLGIKTYPDVGSLPAPIDLAIVVTPAITVPDVITECVDAGVRGAIVISAGFKEIGARGVELEQRILAEARRGQLRIIGPNCLGVMNPQHGLNATFASAMARPGSVAFVSQSGALCTAVLDWSLRESVGFSAFVSVGSMLDVGWGDLIDYLGDDPRTQSILVYMETVGDARSFLSAAREVALAKPIIVIKPGQTEAGAKAAASHTGSLAGRDEVLEAAFRRCGVLRVSNISDLFYMAESLAKQPRPRGPRLAIVTNAGGPAVLAADALLLGGGQMAELSPATMEKLDAVLPPEWSHGDPVDVLGDAGPDRYAAAVEIVAKDPNADGLLVVLTPQAMTDPTQTAEQLRSHARGSGKPILASWMGGAEVAAGEAILNRASVPTFSYPDTATRVFNYMWSYTANLKLLYETPVLSAEGDAHAPDVDGARRILDVARRASRTLLTEAESKRLLTAYGIPTVDTRVATSAKDAAAMATELGFPVAVKLHSETITHKTDVGGVRLNVAEAADVERAFREIRDAVTASAGAEHFLGVTVQRMVALDGYELIVGSSVDPQFGPVLLFGAGGQLVEVLQDHSLALPPLTSTLARRLMERTRIFKALGGVRGRRPVDLARLEDVLVRVSQLVVEQPWIKELDVNPLLASPDDIVALDARVVLHDPKTPERDLPTAAIRPYPRQYVKQWHGRDGLSLTIRPIRPEDEPEMARFHTSLSEQTVYLRYLHAMTLSQRIAHERLARICFVDYDREMVFVAERTIAPAGDGDAAPAREIVGVGRLSRLRLTDDAEFALLVTDAFQHHGLGGELLKHLVAVAKSEKIKRIVGYIAAENHRMLKLAKAIGFRTRRPPDDPTIVEATLSV